jgi:hypothetical protein
MLRNITQALEFEIRKAYSLMLREEHRSRLFENRVLRRIFGPGGMK